MYDFSNSPIDQRLVNLSKTFYSLGFDNMAMSAIVKENNLSYVEQEKIKNITSLYMFFEQNPSIFGEEGGNLAYRRISSECGWAIAGQVLGIASAVAIGGPVGLGFWVAGQAMGIRGIYKNCR